MGDLDAFLDEEYVNAQIDAAKAKINTDAPPGATRTNDEIKITSDLSIDRHPNIPALMKIYDLDPREWEPSDAPGAVIISRYEVTIKHLKADKSTERETVPMWKFSVRFTRRPDYTWLYTLLPLTKWRPPAERPAKLNGKNKLFIASSDLQTPFHDEVLAELMCRVAHDLKVDGWIDCGDESDLPTISRWDKRRPRYTGDRDFNPSVKVTRDKTREVFAARSDALAAWALKVILDSNHGERWEVHHMKRTPETAEILPSFRELCGLPGLGWEVILSDYGSGTYQMAEYALFPDLKFIHGSRAKGFTGAGQSVMEELKRNVGVCIAQGHCNHWAKVHLTRAAGLKDARKVQWGYELGQTAIYEMPYPDERVTDGQKGFFIFEQRPDGRWRDYGMPYDDDNQELVYRDNVWTAKPPLHRAGGVTVEAP